MGQAARLTGYLWLISWDITPELSLPKNSKKWGTAKFPQIRGSHWRAVSLRGGTQCRMAKVLDLALAKRRTRIRG